jgi:cyanoexosortase B-associated protein
MSRSKFAWGQPTERSKVTKSFSLVQWLLLGLLLGLLIIGSLPGYISGKWSWAKTPKIENIQYLKNLSETGLTIPNYQETAREQFKLGDRQWSIQLLNKPGVPPFVVLLMPQDYHKNMPQTEWNDIKSLEKWKVDPPQIMKVPIKSPSSSYQVVTRYFRAWTQTTFMIVQWYAWPGGGHFSNSSWFWADQWQQLSRRRLPWVAVLLKIPIEPTQELKTMLPDVQKIVQDVQTALEAQVFSQLTANK